MRLPKLPISGAHIITGGLHHLRGLADVNTDPLLPYLQACIDEHDARLSEFPQPASAGATPPTTLSRYIPQWSRRSHLKHA